MNSIPWSLIELSKLKNVGIIAPNELSELDGSVIRTIRSLGIGIYCNQIPDERILKNDILLEIGPMYSCSNQIKLLERFVGDLPPIRVWFTEQVPNPKMHTTLVKFLSIMRFKCENHRVDISGKRFRTIGELLTLKQFQEDTIIHTLSSNNTAFLRKLGLNARTTYFAAYPLMGCKTEIPVEKRSIDILFLGRADDQRRIKILDFFTKSFSKLNINFCCYTGGPGCGAIHGNQRTEVVANTKIMLSFPPPVLG
jgi:hypothetical protein